MDGLDKPIHVKWKDRPEVMAGDGVVIRELFGREATGCREISLAAGDVEGGHEASLHYHEKTAEVYFIFHGFGKAQVDDETFDLAPGDVVYVPKGCRHGLTNDSSLELSVLAVSWPAFDKDDFLTD